MIASLRGRIARLDLQQVVVDVGGVGYGARTPLSTYYELEQRGLGAEVELLVHTHVRDDAIELFAFLSLDEQRIFERLITVSGIGPKLAQAVLSGMAPMDLLQALAQGEVARLVRIPGVGKKTAERMILELKDRARTQLEEAGAEAVAVPEPLADLTEALIGLGYRATEADRVASKVLREHPDAALSEALRLALQSLSRV